ncbi:hypothetical protein Vafri_11147 [Volvox africanus]|uniref:Pentacotripeptide-repeat region of PRORP domain-containing protein n=1 Tax=Volvox africanus TaxID=51714 RepID=A0A8J4B899_9CHLO|nr:hypothetical protein Vafri_11147 [Volvox africanus]
MQVKPPSHTFARCIPAVRGPRPCTIAKCVKFERHVCRARLQADNEQNEEERIATARAEVTKRIKSLGAAGRIRDAISALAGLANLGIQPDTPAATALVQACLRDMNLAQSIFDEMFGEFLTPDEVSFAVLLRGYGLLNPPDWPRIDATLTTMRAKYGIEPTAVSFNVLLEICCRTSDIERGQDIIDRMAADGVEPDEFTEEVVARRRVLRSYLRKTFL